jgi:hypothetical protein
MSVVSLMGVMAALVVQQAPEAPKPKWVRLHLEHMQPSVMHELMQEDAWWGTISPKPDRSSGEALPPGMEKIVTYDVDNTLIVRGTQDGIDTVKRFVALYDVMPGHYRIKLRSIPALKRPLDRVWKVQPDVISSLSRQTVKQFANSFVSLKVGPNPFGKDPTIDIGPISDPGWSEWDTWIGAQVIPRSDGSFGIRCGIYYRDENGGTLSLQRKTAALSPGVKSTIVLPIECKSHPVDYYTLEVTVTPQPLKSASPK